MADLLKRILGVGPQTSRSHSTFIYPQRCWRDGCKTKVHRDDLLGLCPSCIEEMRTW